MFSIKPIDRNAIICAAKETGKILTVEEHTILGGLGAIVTQITSTNYPVPVKCLGIPDEHIIAGTSSQVFHYYSLDTDGIVAAAKQLLY